jgi:hypothetical protein
MADEEKTEDTGPRRNPVYRGAVIAQLAPGVDVAYQMHPEWQSGNVDTSDTADLIQNQVSAVSPVFDIHRRNSAVQAARALDPNDPGVERRSVILPGDKTDKQARQEIYDAADYAIANPLIIGGPTGGTVSNEDDDEKAVTDRTPKR